jgi:hypothetical protein
MAMDADGNWMPDDDYMGGPVYDPATATRREDFQQSDQDAAIMFGTDKDWTSIPDMLANVWEGISTTGLTGLAGMFDTSGQSPYAQRQGFGSSEGGAKASEGAGASDWVSKIFGKLGDGSVGKMVLGGIAASAKADRDKEAAERASQIKREDADRISASVTGLRKPKPPGLIQAPFKRGSGANVFNANGSLNRG